MGVEWGLFPVIKEMGDTKALCPGAALQGSAQYHEHLWYQCQLHQRLNPLRLSAKQASVNYKCSHCVSANNSLCFSFSLAAASICLFCLSGWGAGVKPKLGVCTAPLEEGVAGRLPSSSSPGEGALSSWEVPFWHWAMLSSGMGWCRQKEAVFLPFLDNYSQGFLLPSF